MKGEVLALAEDMNEDLEVPFKDLSEEFKRQIVLWQQWTIGYLEL